MNLTLHRLMASAGVAFVLAGLLAVRLSALGFDFWNAPKLEAQLKVEEDLDRTIDAQAEAVARRTAAKEALVLELLDGRIDLFQAASEFYRLNEQQPGFVERLRSHYPGMTDEECIWRNTIDFAATRVEDRPDGPAIVDRLERAFRQLQLSRRGA